MGRSCASKVIGSLVISGLVIQLCMSGLSARAHAQPPEPVSSQAASENETEPALTSSPDAPKVAAAAQPQDAPAEPTATTSSTADSGVDNPPGDEPIGLPVTGKISYQPHVQQIFNAHCIECHGPKQAKAEMRVDDRDTLLSYVAPGDLENSSLWGDYLTTTDAESRMPPVKYGKPLSELELAAIRVWIEDGAEWPDTVTPLINPETAAPIAVAPAPAAAAPRSMVGKVWTFVGFFHPAVVHFPIGLLLVSSLFCALALFRRETFEPAAFHCLWIGTAGALVASFAGWAFADIRGYGDFWHTHWSSDLIARHRITGVGVTAFAIALSVTAFFARRRTSSDLRIVWTMGALMLAGLVSLVGHQGGELTYGEELFSRAYEQAFGPSITDVEPVSVEPVSAAPVSAAASTPPE